MPEQVFTSEQQTLMQMNASSLSLSRTPLTLFPVNDCVFLGCLECQRRFYDQSRNRCVFVLSHSICIWVASSFMPHEALTKTVNEKGKKAVSRCYWVCNEQSVSSATSNVTCLYQSLPSRVVFIVASKCNRAKKERKKLNFYYSISIQQTKFLSERVKNVTYISKKPKLINRNGMRLPKKRQQNDTKCFFTNLILFECAWEKSRKTSSSNDSRC